MYNALKTQLAELLGVTKDALHIHIGLAIFLGVALVFRRSLASWIPWLALLAFELANELMDIFHIHGGVVGFELGDSLKDIVNTMFWPTLVFVAAAGVGIEMVSARLRHLCRSKPTTEAFRTPRSELLIRRTGPAGSDHERQGRDRAP